MGIKKHYNKNMLIDQIVKLNENLGKPPTKRDINDSKHIASWSTFLKTFKSIDNLYKESGIALPNYYRLTDDDLKKLHIKEKRSPKEIADITKRCTTCIYRRLNKIEIFNSAYSVTNNVKTSDRQAEINSVCHQIIDGILISDGYLTGRHKSSFCIGQKYDKHEFVNHIAKTLPFENSVRIYKHQKHWQKHGNDEIRYMSRSYSTILDYAKRWYDSSGTKIVPRDFVIDPMSLLYWFCGDGSLHKTNKRVRLHTNSFCKNDIYKLTSQFESLGVHCDVSGRNEICVKSQSTNTFFDFLGWQSPFKCFAYKWPNKRLPKTRMTLEEKEKMVDVYRNKSCSTRDLSLEFGYSRVAIARMLRTNIPEEEYKKLKGSK